MSTTQAHARAADNWANDALRMDEQRRANVQVVLVRPSTISFLRTWFASRLLLLALVSTVLYYASLRFLGRPDLALVENPLDYTSRTLRLLSRFPLIDGHSDLVYLIRVALKNAIHDTGRFTLGESVLSHTDIPKLRKGQVGGQFWSLYIPCTGKGNFNTPDDTVRDTLEQIDTAHRLFR